MKLSLSCSELKKSSKMFKFIVLLALVFAAESARVNFTACSGGLPTPNWVESNDCTATTCTMRRGQVFLARVNFTPRATFAQLIVSVRASLFGINFPMTIPVGYENACGFLEAGARCPVVANTVYVWAMQFPIDNSYPAAQGLDVERKLIY